MKLLRRSTKPRTSTIRLAERYLTAGAGEARGRGHGYVGTEHVLLAVTRDPEAGAARVLHRLGVTHRDIEQSRCLRGLWAPRIDPDALAALGIDLETVREQLEERFGTGALDQTGAEMLEDTRTRIQCVAPRLELALSHAIDRAGGQPVQDEHVLLGLLSVRDSLAARALAELGVSLEAADAVVRQA